MIYMSFAVILLRILRQSHCYPRKTVMVQKTLEYDQSLAFGTHSPYLSSIRISFMNLYGM